MSYLIAVCFSSYAFHLEAFNELCVKGFGYAYDGRGRAEPGFLTGMWFFSHYIINTIKIDIIKCECKIHINVVIPALFITNLVIILIAAKKFGYFLFI